MIGWHSSECIRPPILLCKLLVEKEILLERPGPARQEEIVSSSNSSSKEWIQAEVLLLLVTKDLLHVHPFHCFYGCHRRRLAIDEAHYSVTVFQWFLWLCEGIFRLLSGKCGKTTGVALRKLSKVSLVIHAFIRLLARAIHSRAILDSHERDALCVSILLSTDIWCKQFVFFKQFCRKCLQWTSAALSQYSTIALERVARGNSLLHAWITNEVFESVSQHDFWLFAAFPEHKSQNSHCNEMCVHPVYLKNQLNKAGSTHKIIFVPFLHGEARVLFVESAPL